MAKTQRGVRDGSGPVGGGIGRRKAAGIKCPVKPVKKTVKKGK